MGIRGFGAVLAAIFGILTAAMAADPGRSGRGVDGRRAGAVRADPPPASSQPRDAPDIVVILLDNVGYGTLGAYGSRIDTPNIDRLAREGLRYTGFNVAASAAATRAELLSGRDPSGSGETPAGVPWLPAMLRPYGYASFAVGAWPLVPPDAASPATGGFGQWPTGRGFDHFYGWLSPWTEQWHPELFRDSTRVDPPRAPGQDYHVSVDLVDQAIRYIDDLASADRTRPYFLYLSFGAAGSPQQAPRDYREKYRGRFAEGYDQERDLVFQRQKIVGAVPPSARLPGREPEIPDWKRMDASHRFLGELFMENYAGFLTHADAQIGRLLDHLQSLGRMSDTVVLLLSSGGAAMDGGVDGVLNRVAAENGVTFDAAQMLARRDAIGASGTAPQIPAGWALACNTPFRGAAGSAGDGAMRVPLILRWPKPLNNPGTTRNPWLYVTDIAPTVLDAVDRWRKDENRTVPSRPPLDGHSFLATVEDTGATGSHETQYWPLDSGAAIYRAGWKAVSVPVSGKGRWTAGLQPGDWRLYHVAEDFAEVEDVGHKFPDKLAEMIARFWNGTGRAGGFPLDHMPEGNRAGQEGATRFRNRHYVFFPDMSPLPEALAPDTFDKSFSMTVFLDRGEFPSEGVLVAQGGATGGWSLYLHDGRLRFAYNRLGLDHYLIEAKEDVPPGKLKVGYRFTRTRKLEGRGELFLDGHKVGDGWISHLVPATFGTEPFDVGRDSQTAVAGDYSAPFVFQGRIDRVELTVED